MTKERRKEIQAKYREKNKEKLKISDTKYRQENKEKIATWRQDHKEELRVYKAKYGQENKGKLKAYKDKWYRENKGKHRARMAKYGQENRGKINAHHKEMCETDPLFKLKHNLRGRTGYYFRRIKIEKPTDTKTLLGAEWEEVKVHIEEQFVEGMAWENHGEWHIDHIIPLASAKNLEEVVPLCHYTNLQPLWATDNLKKGDR